MKIAKNFYRLIALSFVAVTTFVASVTVSAKYSKACSSFKYDGVEVHVIDRHEFVGHLIDSYGYAEYKNNSEEPVTVYWKSFGVLRNSGKLVETGGGKFDLFSGQEIKQVYSYTAGLYINPKDFSKYVIAIEVKPLEPEKVIDYNVEDPSKVNIEKLYKDYKDGKKLTQRQYAEAIAWMDWIFNSELFPYIEEMKRDYAMNAKDDVSEARLYLKWHDRYVAMLRPMRNQEQIGEMLIVSNQKGLLDFANSSAWEALKERIYKFTEKNKEHFNFPYSYWTYEKYLN